LGDNFVGDSVRSVKEGSGKGQLSPYGPRWGTWREVLLPGTLRNSKRGLWKRSVSVYEGCTRGTCREFSFTGVLKDMQRKVLETDVFLYRGPVGTPVRENREICKKEAV